MKDVLVTGAAGGLGKAMIEKLTEKGIRVFAADIQPIDSEEYSTPALVCPIHLDVTSLASLAKAYDQVSSMTNGLQGLVNNAGVPLFGPTIEIDSGKLKELLEVNFIGPQLVTKTFFSLLHKTKGRVINISSESIKYLAPFCLYPMSKRALEGWHEVLKQDLKLLGMDAILIRPGAHETPLVKRYTVPPNPDTKFTREINSFHNQAARGSKKTYDPRDVAQSVYRAPAGRPNHVYHVNNNPILTFLSWLPTTVQRRLNYYLLKKG